MIFKTPVEIYEIVRTTLLLEEHALVISKYLNSCTHIEHQDPSESYSMELVRYLAQIHDILKMLRSHVDRGYPDSVKNTCIFISTLLLPSSRAHGWFELFLMDLHLVLILYDNIPNYMD